MPKIGLTMTEAKVIEWRKKVGDRVEKGEILFVFETEKTTFDVESLQSGYLARIVADVDETVAVGGVVGLLTERPGQEVEWPSGTDGARPPQGAAPAADSPGTPAGRLVKPSTMRRVIAERMLSAKRETAQAYMKASVDATKLLETKNGLAESVEKKAGVRLTITDVLMKVVAAAVSSHPAINSRWTSEGILFLDAVHVGMATALEDGLIVPVIRDVGRKTLAEVAGARARLVERGRAGKLTPDEMAGSTVTLSSLGMLGVEEFTAIINQPESAILAVGAILDRPVAIDKQVVVRPVMSVTLSYDHRVIDGAVAAGFMKSFRELAENPSSVVT